MRKSEALEKKKSKSPARTTLGEVKDLDKSTRRISGVSKVTASKGMEILKGDVESKLGVKGKKKLAKGRKNDFMLVANVKTNTAGIDLGSISTHLAGFGINAERDNFDALDLYAQHIIDLLNQGDYAIVNLTKHEKFLLFRYFYKSNPIVGRIVDLHTELPLSKIKLQAPRDVPEILKDYVMMFYNGVLDNLKFPNLLKDFVLQYWLYGESFMFVDDFYKGSERELQPIEDMVIKNAAMEHSEDDLRFIKEVESKYDINPGDVNLEDRLKYLNVRFLNLFDKAYTGPKRVKPIKFYDIQEYFLNEDIDFEAIRLVISEGLRNIMDSSNEDLKSLGYSEGYIKLVRESVDKTSIIVDNDTYEGVPFCFSFKRYEGISIIQRILDACLEWENSKKAFKLKIGMLGKVGRVVYSDDLGEDQVMDLRSEVELMIDDPTHVIVANYPITWEEVNAFVKEELQDLIDISDRLVNEISLGMGMPESLISGESQYSGDSIKLEVLNNQYFAFKLSIQDLLEEKLLKPIALRKGFIVIDSWGSPKLVYPKLTFSRISLRSEDYFDLLFNLYQKGSLPISIIYDLLNIDSEDIYRALKEDLFTLKDPIFNDLVRGVYSSVADMVIERTTVGDKIINELGLEKKEEPDEGEDNEDGGKDWQ